MSKVSLSTGPCGETAAVLVLSEADLDALGVEFEAESVNATVEEGVLVFDS